MNVISPVIAIPTSAQKKMLVALTPPVLPANTSCETDQKPMSESTPATPMPMQSADMIEVLEILPSPTSEVPMIEATIENAPSSSGNVTAPGMVLPSSRLPSSIAATVVTQYVSNR